jgi:hypothetical protein
MPAPKFIDIDASASSGASFCNAGASRWWQRQNPLQSFLGATKCKYKAARHQGTRSRLMFPDIVPLWR